jgi:hypothetical protein
VEVMLHTKYPYRVGGHTLIPTVPLVIEDEEAIEAFLSSPGVQSRLAKGVLRVTGAPAGAETAGKYRKQGKTASAAPKRRGRPPKEKVQHFGSTAGDEGAEA